jgi:alpha-L-arabinofuranosidase
VLACETVTGADLKAFNTFGNPNKVVTTKLDAARAGARMAVKLPARSYTVVHLGV